MWFLNFLTYLTMAAVAGVLAWHVAGSTAWEGLLSFVVIVVLLALHRAFCVREGRTRFRPTSIFLGVQWVTLIILLSR
ncbi:MAG TPA: hypothetical protein VGN46_05355 [Luteibacter sp.]|jgi:hypothetical protein|uniref:hypothetical protein n=1 Tax=Luteibacter sp. TaxID=1886636 RepID=UPI002F3E8755